MSLWNKSSTSYLSSAASMMDTLQYGVSSQTIYRNIFLQIKELMAEGKQYALFIYRIIYRRSNPRMELSFNDNIPVNVAKDLEEDLNTLLLDKPLHICKKGMDFLICPIFAGVEHNRVGVLAIGGEVSYLKKVKFGMKRKAFRLYLSIIGSVLYQVEYRVDKEHEYYKDSLTGLHDEGMLRRDICRLIERNCEKDYVFVILGVNQLKVVNDYYGHSKGNEVLYEVGKTLREEIGDRENAYRLGGDKFALMLKTGYRESYERISRLLFEIANISFLGIDNKESSGFSISMSASIVELKLIDTEKVPKIFNDYKVDLSHIKHSPDAYVDYLYRIAFDYLTSDGEISFYGERRNIDIGKSKGLASLDQENIPENSDKKEEGGQELREETDGQKDVQDTEDNVKDITNMGISEGENFTDEFFRIESE